MLHRGEDRGPVVKGGVVAGIVGGIVLSAMLMGIAAMNGQDVWGVAKGAAVPLLHERATAPGFDALAVGLGLLCHFAFSIGWGLAFAALAYGLAKNLTLLAGVLWGIVVWFGMYFVVLPIAGMVAVAKAAPAGPTIALHVLFGAALGIAFLPYQRTRTIASGHRTTVG